MKKKIVSIIGARPQFIKYAPLSRHLGRSCREIIIHTGQHYDRNMSELFFEELKIPRPDYNLGLGQGTHAGQTGRMLMAIEALLMKLRPDCVLVFGDTNSTLAGALSAVKLHIPVFHVEAGLRSFNREMPEEHNRIATDHLSDILFAPSRIAVNNLKREGLGKRTFLVGDIMFDALKTHARLAQRRSVILRQLDLRPYEYYLATVHRPSNTDSRTNLKALLDAFSGLDKKVVFPVHPRTRKFIQSYRLKYNPGKISMIDPQGYLDILSLMRNCRKVLTDSGGVQKEAFYLGKSVVVLRNESEWKELVDAGWARLAGADKERIIRYALDRKRPGMHFYPYGKGNTAERIMKILRSEL